MKNHISNSAKRTKNLTNSLTFVSLILGLTFLAISCKKTVSPENEAIGILEVLESIDKNGGKVNYDFYSGDMVTAACIHVTFKNGGTAKYCGPNVDKIKANCASRGWTCKDAANNQVSTIKALSIFLDKLPPKTDYSLTLKSSGGVSKWECTSTVQSAIDACVDAAKEMQASGNWSCSSVEGGAHCEENK